MSKAFPSKTNQVSTMIVRKVPRLALICLMDLSYHCSKNVFTLIIEILILHASKVRGIHALYIILMISSTITEAYFTSAGPASLCLKRFITVVYKRNVCTLLFHPQ
jgi:hypothetical protein